LVDVLPWPLLLHDVMVSDPLLRVVQDVPANAADVSNAVIIVDRIAILIDIFLSRYC